MPPPAAPQQIDLSAGLEPISQPPPQHATSADFMAAAARPAAQPTQPAAAPAPSRTATSADFMAAAGTPQQPAAAAPIDLSAGIETKSTAPPIPSSTGEKLFGVHPLSDTFSSAWEHAKNLVMGPYHALTDKLTPEEEQMYKEHPTLLGTNQGAGDVAVNRMFVEPTLRALKQAEQLRAAGGPQASLTAPSTYDAQAQNVPTAGSKLVDAIPIYGPWSRAYTDEVHQKGALPATAGLAVDVLGPKAAESGIGATAGLAKDFAVDRATDFARSMTGTSTGAVKDIVRKTMISNDDIQAATDKANQSAKAAHDAATEAANANNEQAGQMAIERSRQLHQQAVNDAQAANDLKAQQHTQNVQGIEADNAAATDAADKANQQAHDEAAAQHAQDTQDAADLETNRGQLARKAIELKNRLAQNVQATAEKVKSSLDDRFDAVRDKIGVDTEAPVAPLANVAVKEAADLGETGDRVAQFKNIVDRAKVDSAIEDLRDIVAHRDFDQPYDSLPESHKGAVDETVAGENPQDLDPQTITYGQLRRISSKLGSAAYNMDDKFLGSAITRVKLRADAMAQQMAREAGIGTEHKNLLHDWSTYKSVFDEPNGPSGSGSQVAQAVNANEPYHATAPFLADDPFVADKAKQLLIGKPASVGGSYYNPQGGRLIDSLRRTMAAQDELPKPKEVGEFTPPEPVQPKLQAIPEPPAPTPGPTQARIVQPGQEGVPKMQEVPPPFTPKPADVESITPESLQRNLYEKAVGTMAAKRGFAVQHATRIAAGTVGLAAGIGEMLLRTAPQAGIGPITGGLVGITAVLGYRGLLKLLDSDKVIQQLSKPTLAQYQEVMKMPPELRAGVADAIDKLNAEAIREGKYDQDSPWIRAFQTFLKPEPSRAAAGAVAASTAASQQQSKQPPVMPPPAAPSAAAGANPQ